MKKECKSLSLPLSLGFIGGSTKSAVGYTHFVASQMDNSWKLAAGCFSHNFRDNQETANVYGVPPERVYESWKEMLDTEQGKLDAVAILTPTPMHFELVKACLERGYAVICEKALAMSSDEIKQIIDLRDKMNGFIAVNYNYSGYPMVRELRSIIKSGQLGQILHFQAEMPQEGFIRVDTGGNKPTPQAWRLLDGQIPTIYLDLAVHLHQLIDYLIQQKPLAVVATQDSFGWFPEIVDNVSSLCRYTEGIQGQFWFSKSALGHRNGLKLRIYGSHASAEWYQANPEELILAYADGRREILDRAARTEIAKDLRYNRFKSGHPAGFIEAFANLYVDIANALIEYNSSGSYHSSEVFGADLALEGLQMLEAMVLSGSKGWTKTPPQH
ncbi:Gfo/Idh/MocA family protein [Chamaesiphon polymorphus]|uniref:Gfo/Idh/MocA family oxidoreductase n=1 Tax=Chamaesiphon polymorphus CCALA 037 TaxID=2107692 RepID=A0A2T1GCN7_9CYAN|nr:Gfo/Idh/MocA family oxidoreductase [Chamaesiphon polymorphus]PSB55167.1 gfo/Idh/MocA family oxidoreductase [Chamaesiphon polymorphus CCALA 037]